MDPVSSLSQTRLDTGKLKLRPGKGLKISTVLGFVAVVLVIAGLLTGGYILITRSSQPVATDGQATDNSPLEIRIQRLDRTVSNPSTEFTLVSNKVITMRQHNRASLHEIGEGSGWKYYVVRVVNLPTDKTELTFKFDDTAGNYFEQKVSVTRKASSFPAGFTQILPWQDAGYVLEADKLDAVVDNKHRLLEDYEPTDLVDLNKDYGVYTLNSAKLRREAAVALKAMLDDLATATGKYVTAASGYRSYEQQVATYANFVRQYGEAKANTFSAKPGHSQHQLGTTVDFVSDETNWAISADFGKTRAGEWLAANCGRFGYVQPYKLEGTDKTGYVEESWHFRFVGVQISQ